eukprot:1895693-Alexandrium_andersonii.AAC.1
MACRLFWKTSPTLAHSRSQTGCGVMSHRCLQRCSLQGICLPGIPRARGSTPCAGGRRPRARDATR